MHINELRDKLAGVLDEIDEATAKDELTDEERTDLEAKEAEADKLIKDIEDAQKREARKTQFASIPANEPVAKPEVRVEVTRNEPTYRPDNGTSYFKDLIGERLGTAGPEARDRLMRNNAEYRDLSRTDTTSVGEFVPPAWLIDLYMPGLRAGRVTADLCTNMELPPNTDSINIPRISTNPTVAAQTADNASVNEVDAVSATVNAPVRTFAGQNDVAVQVLDQSPLSGGIDQMIFRELVDDLDRYTDAQVLNGGGGSGTVTGILATSGIKDANYTDASPTVAELFSDGAIFKVQSLVVSSRYAPIEACVMHPRRWYWLAGAVDSGNRPLVTTINQGPHNANAVGGGGVAEGPVGTISGVPIYLDANVPTNLGGGTEDAIIFGRFSDAMLFEGGLRQRVMPEVLSGTLTVRIQLYRYVAFTAARAGGVGFGTVTDTGLAAPSGY